MHSSDCHFLNLCIYSDKVYRYILTFEAKGSLMMSKWCFCHPDRQGGRYSPKAKNPLGPDGIVWYTWKDSDYYSLRKVSMMIRPRTFRQHLSPWIRPDQWARADDVNQPITVLRATAMYAWILSWLYSEKCVYGLVHFSECTQRRPLFTAGLYQRVKTSEGLLLKQ